MTEYTVYDTQDPSWSREGLTEYEAIKLCIERNTTDDFHVGNRFKIAYRYEHPEFTPRPLARVVDDRTHKLMELTHAAEALHGFTTKLVERHGMDGGGTMTDADHTEWQEVASAVAAASAEANAEVNEQIARLHSVDDMRDKSFADLCIAIAALDNLRRAPALDMRDCNLERIVRTAEGVISRNLRSFGAKEDAACDLFDYEALYAACQAKNIYKDGDEDAA